MIKIDKFPGIDCKINLNKSQIFVDEQINGEILFNFSNPISIKRMTVLVYGEAQKIPENYKPTSETDLDKYESTFNLNSDKENKDKAEKCCEIFFRDKWNVFNKSSDQQLEDGETFEVPAGEYAFPIRCTIPLNCPSSFNLMHLGDTFSIEYRIIIFLYTNTTTSCIAEKIFDVYKPIDLNLIREAKEPINFFNKQMNSCCCCIPIGHVSLNIKLPQKGFVAGSTIDVIVECVNKTYFGIKMLKIKLCILLTYNRPDIPFKYEREIESVSAGSVQSLENRIFERSLKIPPIMPWNTSGCKLFKIEYILEVVCEFPALLCNIEESVPIIIGSKPIIEDNQNVSTNHKLFYIKHILKKKHLQQEISSREHESFNKRDSITDSNINDESV